MPKPLLPALTAAAWLSIAGTSMAPTKALAEDQAAAQRTLTLTGQGVASASPDLVWLTLGVTTQAAQAQEALRANAEAMTKVIAALKSDGLPDKDLQTSNLSIIPQYPIDSKQVRTIVGYRVSNTVTVRIRDLKKTGAVLDQVVALGANDIANLAFDIADPSATQNEARAAAVRDALAKAKTYAAAAGIELGPIMQITEEAPGEFAPAMQRLRAVPAGVASTPLESGDLTYRALVNVTWTIR